MLPDECDVAIVGAGNAAMCAALSARERGASVVVLERAPEDEAGGNTRFTAGAIRFAYNGVDDLRELMPDLTDEEVARTDFGAYTEDQFFDDMARVTENRTDPDLAELLVPIRAVHGAAFARERGEFAPADVNRGVELLLLIPLLTWLRENPRRQTIGDSGGSSWNRH